MISHRECIRVILDGEYKEYMDSISELAYSDVEEYRVATINSMLRLRNWNRGTKLLLFSTALILNLNQLFSLINNIRALRV